jgi:hypothetical protein
VSLGINDGTGGFTLSVYQNEFCDPFYAATEHFYTTESNSYISMNTVCDYMRKAEARLEEENIRYASASDWSCNIIIACPEDLFFLFVPLFVCLFKVVWFVLFSSVFVLTVGFSVRRFFFPILTPSLTTYLHPSSEEELMQRCCKALIDKHKDTIWHEFPTLLQNDKLEVCEWFLFWWLLLLFCVCLECRNIFRC